MSTVISLPKRFLPILLIYFDTTDMGGLKQPINIHPFNWGSFPTNEKQSVLPMQQTSFKIPPETGYKVDRPA